MVLCLRWIQNPDRSMLNTALPSIAVYQDYYGGHYKKTKNKKITAHVMMLWKYKPLDQDDTL
jgi:hypothetical protein